MIAYAIGRMGCHVSGDGDWGIFNSAYKVNDKQQIVPAADWEFHNTLMNNGEYTRSLIAEYGHLDSIPHVRFEGLSFLPNWFWAYNYPHNVNEVGVAIPGCEGQYCNQLSPPVFPTPLYEIVTCFLLFILLWAIRKRIAIPGRLFAVYLMLNGLERFFIEKIRVNTTYDIAGFHPTQAELISSSLIVMGAWLWIRFGKMQPKTSKS
jgi:prolipoprotein diacylglyceryltransferase